MNLSDIILSFRENIKCHTTFYLGNDLGIFDHKIFDKYKELFCNLNTESSIYFEIYFISYRT